MSACSVSECDLDTESGLEECILHCEKEDYGTDYHKGGFLHRFYKALAAYVAKEQVSHEWERQTFSVEEFTDFLLDRETTNREALQQATENARIVFTRFHFPGRDSRDPFDYQKLLAKLGGIHFNYCVFALHSISLHEVQCFFQDCEFKLAWYLSNHPVLGNHNDVLYQSCKFREDVSGSGEGSDQLVLNENQFHNCVFDKELAFYGVDFNGQLFKNSEDYVTEIPKFVAKDCRIDAKLCANALKVDQLLIGNTEFSEKVELKNSSVLNLEIMNCNFSKIFDAHGASFEELYIERCIFEEFVGFEECKFGLSKPIRWEEYCLRYSSTLRLASLSILEKRCFIRD